MCENPEPRPINADPEHVTDEELKQRRSFGFRSDTIAPTETAWESVGERAPLFEVFGIAEAEERGDGDVYVSPVRCEWFARCTNVSTHVVAHPAFPSGVPACDAHGV